MRVDRNLWAALSVAVLLAGCGRSDGGDRGAPTAAPTPELDDPGVFVRLAATAADNGADAISVSCTRTVLCTDLHLSLRGATRFTLTGPGGAVVTVGDARVSLPAGREATARGEVTFDFGAVELRKMFDPMAEPPALTLRVKVERRGGMVEEESVALTLSSTLTEVLRGAAQRPTVFAGEAAEGHRPPILFDEHEQAFYGQPALVRDVDVVALWLPKAKRPGKLCGPYQTGPTGPPTHVETELQDYDVRVVERRTGKVLTERSLRAEDGPCPTSFLARKGKPLAITPDATPIRTFLESLRK